MSTPSLTQAVSRARAALGKHAMVELTQTLGPDGLCICWRVGVRGVDSYAWAEMGVSDESFDAALHMAQGKRKVKPK